MFDVCGGACAQTHCLNPNPEGEAGSSAGWSGVKRWVVWGQALGGLGQGWVRAVVLHGLEGPC
eukprot:186935-Chlamydomonas_euryale.AAC.1